MSTTHWYMPEESHTHQRTWMALGVSKKLWGKLLEKEASQDLCQLANTIAEFEPVTMLVTADSHDLAKEKCGHGVELVLTSLDDIWIRDSGPVFVIDGKGAIAGINFNFNGWGNKQEHRFDSKVAEFVIKHVTSSDIIRTDLVMEGGGLEVDGEGSAIITESCVLNNNRNKGATKMTVEEKLRGLMSIDKVIWLPGVRGADITDGHTDFYARFVRPGVVLAHQETDKSSPDYVISQQQINILKMTTDARGRKLEVHVLPGPAEIRPKYRKYRDTFCASYINYYVCNGAVICPEYNHKASDEFAKEKLQRLYPDRVVRLVNIDAVACGGGGIHCVTQQEPQP